MIDSRQFSFIRKYWSHVPLSIIHISWPGNDALVSFHREYPQWFRWDTSTSKITIKFPSLASPQNSVPSLEWIMVFKCCPFFFIRSRKKNCVFPLTSLKNLGSVDGDFVLFFHFFIFFFGGGRYLTWNYDKSKFITHIQKKKSRLAKNWVGPVSGNTTFFLFGLSPYIAEVWM